MIGQPPPASHGQGHESGGPSRSNWQGDRDCHRAVVTAGSESVARVRVAAAATVTVTAAGRGRCRASALAACSLEAT
jgi:hypothetical protein